MPTFNEALQQLKRNKDNYKDFKVKYSDIEVIDHEKDVCIKGTHYPMTKTGLTTFARTLHMPKKYLCSNYPVKTEFAEHANTLLKLDPEEEVLIRTFGDTIRAILPPTYYIYDDYDALLMLENYLLNKEKAQFKLYRTEENYNVFVLYFGQELNVDSVHYMVRIMNSEVGLGNLRVEFGLYRVVDENMLVIPESKYGYFEWNHSNKKARKVPDSILMVYDRGIVAWKDLNKALDESRLINLPEDKELMFDIVRKLEKEKAVSSRFAKKLINGFEGERPSKLFGLICEMTRLAGQENSIKSQMRYEAVASVLLIAETLNKLVGETANV